MARRSRILAFGSAAVLVIAGGVCAAVVNGLTGRLLTIVLMSLGLGGAVLLIFLEVGLSEDRERALDEERRRERRRERTSAGQKRPASWRLRARRRPRRPE